MKREDVKNKIPGITDEQLNWLMQENGADINREKSAATALTKTTVYEKIVTPAPSCPTPTSPPAAGRKAAQHDNNPAVPVIPVPWGCFCIYWSIKMRSSCTTSCSARQIRSTSGELSIAPAACMRLMSCCALASAAQICVRFSSEIFIIITILF